MIPSTPLSILPTERRAFVTLSNTRYAFLEYVLAKIQLILVDSATDSATVFDFDASVVLSVVALGLDGLRY